MNLSMARKKKFTEMILTGYPTGTRARIDAVISDVEDRNEIIRRALDRELKRLEQAKKAKS